MCNNVKTIKIVQKFYSHKVLMQISQIRIREKEIWNDVLKLKMERK